MQHKPYPTLNLESKQVKMYKANAFQRIHVLQVTMSSTDHVNDTIKFCRINSKFRVQKSLQLPSASDV